MAEPFNHEWRALSLDDYISTIANRCNVSFTDLTVDQRLKVIELAIKLQDGDIKDEDNTGFARLLEGLTAAIESGLEGIGDVL